MKSHANLIILSLAIILLSSFTVPVNVTTYSDLIIVFEDNFDDNSKNWVLGTQYSEGTIQDGYFELSSMGERSDIRIQSLDIVNESYDFEVESSIRILGDSDFCNSIIWGSPSVGGHYERGLSFGFNSNKEFIALNTQDWIAEDLTNWEITEIIQPNDFNKVLLKKIGNEYRFYINDILVKTLPFVEFEGYNFGFHAANGATIQVDYFKVSVYAPRV